MADNQIEGLPEGATVGPALQTQPQIEGLPEGATVGPKLQTKTTQSTQAAPKEKEPGMLDVANKAYEGEAPVAPAFSTEYAGNALRRLGSSAGRTLMMAPNMAVGAYHAITDAPKDSTEQAIETAGGGLTGRGLLAAKRLAYDPSRDTIEQEKQHEAADAAAGLPHSTAEKVLNRAVSSVPLMGPFVEAEGQRAGKGDILGAVGDVAGLEAGGRAFHEAPKEFPTVKAAADATVRGMGKTYNAGRAALPTAGAIAGGVAGSMHGGPGGAIMGSYFGGREGTIAGRALPEMGKSITQRGRIPEVANVESLTKDYNVADKALKKAMEDHSKYAATEAQGPIDPETNPAYKKSLDAVRKAQDAKVEAHMHLENATKAAEAAKTAAGAPADQDITPDAVAAARPEAHTPTNEELNARQAALMGKFEKQVGIGVPPAANVKVPGQVQPETFPQEPTEAPRVTMGRTELAGGKGTMGNPRLLTEGVPNRPEPIAEGTPNRPEPIGEVLPPEKPAKPGRMGKLKVNDKGIVVDTEDPLQQKIEEGLQGTPKAVATPAPKAEATAPKSEKTLGEREAALLEKMRAVSKPEIPEKTTVTGHELGVAPIETKAEDVGAKVRAEAPPMPRGERRAAPRTAEENAATELFRQARKELGDDATNEQIDARIAEIKAEKSKAQEAPKAEELTSPHEKELANEGRSPEDVTKVQDLLKDHTDQELIREAKLQGLDESKYDFNKRSDDVHRHRVDRNQLAQDILAKWSDADVDKAAGLWDKWHSNDTSLWSEAEKSQLSKAQRARAIMQELRGGPKTVAGGAPDAVGTKEGAEKDTDHFAQAKKELPNGTLSEQLGRAQELKAAAKKDALMHSEVAPQSAGEKSRLELLKVYDPYTRGLPEQEIVPKGAQEAYEEWKNKSTAENWKKFSSKFPDERAANAYSNSEALKYQRDRYVKTGAPGQAGVFWTKEPFLKAQENLKLREGKPESDIREQIGTHNANGGSTFHPTKGNLKGQPYFSVGGEPEFRNPKLSMVTEGGEMSADQLKEFSERPEVKAALAKHPDASIGTWHDTEADQTITELVKTPTDRAEAIEMGKKNNQKAIFDLKEGKEIPTGGTAGEEAQAKAEEKPTGQKERTGDTFHHGTSWEEADKVAKEGLKANPKVWATTEPWAAEEYGKSKTEDAGDKYATVTFEHPFDKTEPDPEHNLVEGEGDLYRRISEPVSKDKIKSIKYFDGEDLVKEVKPSEEAKPYAPKPEKAAESAAREAYFESVRTSGKATNAPYAKTGNPDWNDITEKPAAKPYKDMTKEEQEALAAKGQSGASGKALTGEQLLKKYGESEGDPAHTAFILKDGRGVNLPDGAVHDEMLGGRTDDKIPPREAFISDGNIRIRPRTGKGGREFSISVPESGISEAQLKHLNKMAPQMGSGTVNVEIGKPGGDYRQIEYGKASAQLEQTLRDLVPIKNAKGSPVDEFGNPTVSGGSPAASTALAKIKDKVNVLPRGEIDADTLNNGRIRHYLLSDGSMISENVPIHSDIEGKVGKQVLSEAKGIRMAGPREFDVYSEPTAQQRAELSRITKDAQGKLYWTVKPTTGSDLGGAGSMADFQRDLDKAYPAATKTAKEANVPLGELAEKYGTAEEKAGVNKSVASTKRFVDNMSKIPEVHEYTDIANAGAGARKWYQRSTKAFDAMAEEAPEYFDKEGDRDKFINLLAASSPRQSVAMNLRETLRTWKAYVDAGRPTGDALKDILQDNLTPATSKVPNALKALNDEEMWPDITKNKNFKVPSFARNLRGYLDSVTNDGWMSLFAGLDPREISSAHSYHPLSIATRAAADELGWEPAEAQAAIWSFTQALTERGETLPDEVRKHSEDFVDLMQNDPQVRELLSDLGVSHGNLDAKLAAIGAKPEVSSRTSPTTSRSVIRLGERIEKARGKGAVPPPKSAQGELGFREAPAGESRNRVDDEGDTSFNPDEIMGKKKKVGMGK